MCEILTIIALITKRCLQHNSVSLQILLNAYLDYVREENSHFSCELCLWTFETGAE